MKVAVIILVGLLTLGRGCELDPIYEERVAKQLDYFKDGISPKMVKDAVSHANCYVKIENHVVSSSCQHSTYTDSQKYIQEIAKDLPDLVFAYTQLDEPQVAKHVACREHFTTKQYSCYCDKGFTPERHSYFLFPYGPPMKERVPIFSLCKIPECHLDILMPASHFFEQTQSFDDQLTPWAEREFKAFWRGGLSEGDLKTADDNFLLSHRVSLVDKCKKIADCDAGLTSYAGKNCKVKRKLRKQYPLKGKVPLRKQHKYKILLDIDGVTFSQRFPMLLKLGAAVFKMAAFDDIGNIGMTPWQHYVPVKMDLSDLEEKLQWAKDNDQKLQAIAKRGQERALKVLNRQTYKCYFKKLLLGYSELVAKGRKIDLQ